MKKLSSMSFLPHISSPAMSRRVLTLPISPISPVAAKKTQRKKISQLPRRNSTDPMMRGRPLYMTKQKDYQASISGLFSSDDLLKVTKTELTFTIISNYGHPTEISCAEIDFLTENYEMANVSSVYFDGVLKNTENYKFLVNNIMDKKEQKECWHEKWPPEFPRSTYTMKFFLSASSEINYIRIWPNTIDSSKNIKTVVISKGNEMIYHGDFPYDFGNVISLHNCDTLFKCSPMIADLIDGNMSPADNAIFKVRQIRLCPYESYAERHFFGLNHIFLFDYKGRQLFAKDGAIINLFNSESTSNLEPLLRQIPSSNDLFLSDATFSVVGSIEESTYLEISFPRFVFLGAIAILNPIFLEGIQNESTKKMRVYFDKKKVWNGRIKYRTSEKAVEIDSATFIWFIEDTAYQASVRRQFPTREQKEKVGPEVM